MATKRISSATEKLKRKQKKQYILRQKKDLREADSERRKNLRLWRPEMPLAPSEEARVQGIVRRAFKKAEIDYYATNNELIGALEGVVRSHHPDYLNRNPEFRGMYNSRLALYISDSIKGFPTGKLSRILSEEIKKSFGKRK